jgi:hypothetical protein
VNLDLQRREHLAGIPGAEEDTAVGLGGDLELEIEDEVSVLGLRLASARSAAKSGCHVEVSGWGLGAAASGRSAARNRRGRRGIRVRSAW